MGAGEEGVDAEDGACEAGEYIAMCSVPCKAVHPLSILSH